MQENQKYNEITSQELDFIEKGKSNIKKIVTIFTIIILVGMPLVVWDKYFDILKVKYIFYYVAVLTMLMVLAVECLIWIWKDRQLFNGNCLKIVKGKKRTRLSVSDLSVLAFTIITAISTLQSDFLYESFWGNEGRFNGLFMTLLFCVVYFLISRFMDYKRWMIDVFFCVGVIVCIWGILNFFKLDPFDFKEDLVSEDWGIFTSTIGNINTYTAFVALFMGTSSIMFISSDTYKQRLWYYLCMLVSFFAIIMGISDNAYIAIGALMGLIPFYAFRTGVGCRRYLIVLVTLLTVMLSISSICETWPAQVMEFSSILKIIAKREELKYLAGILWGVCIVWEVLVYRRESASSKKLVWTRVVWLIICIQVLCTILYILYDANWGPNPEKYSAYSQYLIFNDDWGTHRMYNWKLGLRLYSQFPFMHKLFGYGPETYGILTIFSSYDEMTSRYNEVFENIHNEYLQYMITIGPIGMIAYISVIVSSISMAFKRALDKPWVMACVFAILCYAIQATVNIAQAITTPILWLLISLMVAGCRRTHGKSDAGDFKPIEELK